MALVVLEASKLTNPEPLKHVYCIKHVDLEVYHGATQAITTHHHYDRNGGLFPCNAVLKGEIAPRQAKQETDGA